MTKFILRFVLLTAAFLSAPLHAEKLRDAFIDIKEKTLKKEYSHLAMMPIVAMPAAALPDETKKLIEADVLSRLEKEHFTILPAQKVEAIQTQFASLYPENPSAEMQAAIEEHTAREVFFRHPVNGLVGIQVMVVPAPFANDKAQWHGTSQKIEHEGDGFFGTIMGKDYGGHIAASSIRILISDRTRKILYNWSGGVEVMMQRNGEKLEAIPREGLWQEEKRVEKAVKLALKPF